MKSWSCLCFLVLVMSSVSRGQNKTTKEAVSTPPPLPAAGAKPSTAPPTTASPQNNTSANATDGHSTEFTTPEGTLSTDDLVNKTTEEVNGSSAAAQTTTTTTTPSVSTTQSGGDVDVNDGVRKATASTSSTLAPPGGPSHPSWGYVVLALIFIVIIVLCVILFFLRRVSRTYSFDLHRQAPANHFNEPTGTFEPVYLDDLDQPASKDQVTTDDLSPPPVSNGTTLPPEERDSNGDNAPATQEPPDATGQTMPDAASPSLGDDPGDQTPSPLSSSTNLFFDVTGEEQQNENNNNPSVHSSDPFVDINLDEPVWCNQLLTSPEDSSSVLPFSPFSFSSSSSSSSSSLHP